jgi:hypothetical protein
MARISLTHTTNPSNVEDASRPTRQPIQEQKSVWLSIFLIHLRTYLYRCSAAEMASMTSNEQGAESEALQQ